MASLAPAAAAAERAITGVGRILLANGVVDSADSLALAAIEGDPVAAAISGLHHGSRPVAESLEQQSALAGRVTDALAAWREEPSEERQDNLYDAVERLRDDIAAIYGELMLPVLSNLTAAVSQISRGSFGAAAQQPLSDDLAEIQHALSAVADDVRSWNYRRSKTIRRAGAGTCPLSIPCWSVCTRTAAT